MPWVKVDEKFTRGRKVKRAALSLGGGKRNRARVLAVWLDAMSYCNLHLTDGFFPDDEADDLPDTKPDEVFAAMAGGDDELGPIVERDERRKGWIFRNYADYQPTKNDVESKLERDRIRQRVRRMSTTSPRGQSAESVTTDPIRSDPVRSDPTEPTQESAAAVAENTGRWVKPSDAARGAGARHGLVNGAELRRHAGHAWCSEREGLCIPEFLHAEFCGKSGRSPADLLAWYPSALALFHGRAIGEDALMFWRNCFAQWVGTATSRPSGSRPKPGAPEYHAAAGDWFAECQRLHAGQCNGSGAHRTQMALDADRATRSA